MPAQAAALKDARQFEFAKFHGGPDPLVGGRGQSRCEAVAVAEAEASRLIYAQDVAVLISSAQQPAIYVPLLQQQLQLQLHSSSTASAAAAATVAAWNALWRSRTVGDSIEFSSLKCNALKT